MNNKTATPQDYQPFTEEWRKEMMRLPKPLLIDEFIKKKHMEVERLKEENERLAEERIKLRIKLKEAVSFLKDDHFKHDDVISQFCIYAEKLLNK